MPVNHQIADAYVATGDASGNYSSTVDTTGADYTTAEVNPTGNSLFGGRAAWWKIGASELYSYLTVTATVSVGAEMVVWYRTWNGIWDFQSNAYGNAYPGSPFQRQFQLTPYQGQPKEYYVRVASLDPDVGQQITLDVEGLTPDSPAPEAVEAIPVSLAVQMGDAQVTYTEEDDPTQHQWRNALAVNPDANGVFSRQAVTNIEFTANETYPPDAGSSVSSGMEGYRAAWWQYICYADATMAITGSGSSSAVQLSVFASDIDEVWSLEDGGQALSVSLSVPLLAGRTYWVRVASVSDVLQGYTISGTIALSVASGAILAAPIRTRVRQVAAGVSQPRINAVPLHVGVGLKTSSLDVVLVPPITVRVGLSAATTDIVMVPSSPEPGEVVAANPPQLVVGFTSTDDPDTVYTIEVQYDDNAAFSSPVSLDDDIAVSDGGATFTPAAPLSGTTWWRARLLKDGEQLLGWSIPRSFTVSTTPDPAELIVTYTIDADQDRPIHLWHLDPDGGEPGDIVTAYGQGFPSTGHIVVGTFNAQIQSWTLVAANPGLAPEPTIDDDLVTPEHYEVQFLVPELEEPGGTLSVEA